MSPIRKVFNMKKKIEKKKYYRSWTLSDELWERVKDEIPQRKRDTNKEYKNKPGQGRKPIPPRKILEGILYVLRTGCQWKAVPKEYGAGSSIHKYFQEWETAGFFEKLWAMKKDLGADLRYDWDRLDSDWKVLGELEQLGLDNRAERLRGAFSGPESVICRGIEVGVEQQKFYLRDDEIFPVKNIEFEGLEFKSPADADAYLKKLYGDYMAFPKVMRPHDDIRGRISPEAEAKMNELISAAGID